MSISGSLSNALSGLTAAGRAAAVVSSNISNSMTEGYGKRDLVLTERMLAGTGAGVRVVGITRSVDPVLLGNRRVAEAELAHPGVLLEVFWRNRDRFWCIVQRSVLHHLATDLGDFTFQATDTGLTSVMPDQVGDRF